MTNPAAFECKKDRLYQTQDGLWKLTVTVHPNDMPDWLLKAPMGQRIGATALQEIREDEPVPEKPKERWADKSPAQQAGIRCQDERFRIWLFDAYPDESDIGFVSGEHAAAATVRKICGVQSRSELNTNTDARVRWAALDTEFMQAIGLMAKVEP